MTTQNNKDSNKTSSTKNDEKARSSEKATPQHGKQGFASMPTEQVREIASKGGKASHK